MSSAASLFTETGSSQDKEIHECRELCFKHTLAGMRAAGLADDSEAQRLEQRYLHHLDEGDPRDLVELLARMKGADDDHIGAETARISHQLSAVIPAAPPLIPFAGKLMAPSSFYEAYTNIHALAKALLSPVIFAEDTDAIGTGALNPIASMIMADRILGAVNRRFAIRPFVTSVRLDYESWCFLNRKHFGL